MFPFSLMMIETSYLFWPGNTSYLDKMIQENRRKEREARRTRQAGKRVSDEGEHEASKITQEGVRPL